MIKKAKLLFLVLKKKFLKLGQGYFNFVDSNVECNICGYKSNRFKSNNWHSYTICPYCSSDVRQRLFMASISLLDKFNLDEIIRNKNILHFAPSNSLGKLIKNYTKHYKTADFLAEGYVYDSIDFNIDISNMKTIKDESFDCVIAFDVLEHVPDDKAGIKEVYRVLCQGGYSIFTVPQKDNLKNTIEDLSITDRTEREKIFGQHDHLRIYGDDFVTMLEDVGFEVTAVNESFFDKEIVEHFVLFPPILSNNPLATNYRKVFFGKKR